jgi:hypothetical protein
MMTIRGSLSAEAEQLAEWSWSDLLRDPVERLKVIYSAGAPVAQYINCIQFFYYFGTVLSQAIGLEDPFLDEHHCFHDPDRYSLGCDCLSKQDSKATATITTTLIMMASTFIVGCLGIPGGDVSSTFAKVFIGFVIIATTAFNFAWGPLGWTVVIVVPAIGG